MTRKYKYDTFMRILAGLSALAVGVFCLDALTTLKMINISLEDPHFLNNVFPKICGMVLSTLTIMLIFFPDNPIPCHWLTFIILGISQLITTSEIPLFSLGVICAGIIGLIDGYKTSKGGENVRTTDGSKEISIKIST